uniref:J domain-containing protein n=1 Tax=Ciona savignyi TaxID=51511 RepID=H2YCA0_CIOSA
MDFLNGVLSDDQVDDYYEILGCNELSNTEQILTEYRIKAKQIHPDKNKTESGLKANAEFAKLQKAKEVLTNPKLRKEYNFWKSSGLSISFELWKSMQAQTKTTMHWAHKVKYNPMLESTGENKDCHQTSSTFSENTPSEEILKQFRNYKI